MPPPKLIADIAQPADDEHVNPMVAFLSGFLMMAVASRGESAGVTRVCITGLTTFDVTFKDGLKIAVAVAEKPSP